MLPAIGIGTEHAATATATTSTAVVDPARGIAHSIFRESFGAFLPRVHE